MPKELFPGRLVAVDGKGDSGLSRWLAVTWGKDQDAVEVAGVALERHDVERLLRTLRRAYDATYRDVEDDPTARLVRAMDDLSLRLSAIEDRLRPVTINNYGAEAMPAEQVAAEVSAAIRRARQQRTR